MIPKVIRFFKTPAGWALLGLLGTFTFFYFVREYRERREPEGTRANPGKKTLVGQMAPEEVGADPDKAITSQWVEENQLDRFASIHETDAAKAPAPEPPRKGPAAMPKLVHFSKGSEPPKEVASAEPPKAPRLYAPPGILIPCQLVITVDSSSLETPVVGFVTDDLWHNGNLIIPAGTEVHCFAKRGRVRDRIEVNGEWKFVWNDGREVRVRGLALDREYSPSGDAYGITDGSAGIRGRLVKSDEFLEFKMFAAAAVSAAARQSEETTQTIFGSKPENTLENGALEGASAVAERYSKLLLDQIEGDGLYVRVPAGTEFYVYTLQVFEPKLASVAGLKQGQKPRNSWELIDPAKGDPNIKPPSEALEDLLKTLRPVTPAEALKRRDLLTAEVEKHLRNNGQLTESNP